MARPERWATPRRTRVQLQPDGGEVVPGLCIPMRIPNWYAAGVATEQIAVRLPVEQLEVLDDLVSRGVYDSRAAAVRAGIEAVLELDRRRQDDDAIVKGYREKPPTDSEQAAAMSSLREAIAEEPW